MTSLHTRNISANTSELTDASDDVLRPMSMSTVLRCRDGLETSMRKRHATSSAPDLPLSTPDARPPMVNMWCTTFMKSPQTAQ